MAEADLEAKKLHTKRLEEMLAAPVFDIFHIQRAQLAEKTESDNSLLFHFKSSMARVRTWNSGTVRNFVGGLIERFPILGDEFENTFQELQQVTCRILNASSNINEYEATNEPSHTYLHELISACADSFISHPEWFKVSPSSPEHQTVLNNMKVRMGQSAVVANAVMAFTKTSRQAQDASEDRHSDMDIFEDNDSGDSASSDASSVKGSKSINVKSGVVTEDAEDSNKTEDEPPPPPEEHEKPTAEAEGDAPRADDRDTSGDRVDDHSSSDESGEEGRGDESSASFYSGDSYSSDLVLSSTDDSGSDTSTDLELPDTSGSSTDPEQSSGSSTGREQSDTSSSHGSDASTHSEGSDTPTCSDGSHTSSHAEESDATGGDASMDTDDHSSVDDSDCMSYYSSSGSDTAGSDSATRSEDTEDTTTEGSSGESLCSLHWESVSDGSSYTAEESGPD